jgi:hypothetical protein
MKVHPENVSGEIVESHQFSHSVQHQVNWSHFLVALVVVVVVWKLGPAAAQWAEDKNR